MAKTTSIRIGEDQVVLDDDGHLADPQQWTREVACALADRDGIELGPDHWWLIEFVRDYHHTYGTPPLMRVVVSALRDKRGDAAASSRDLYRLFSDNPVRQACCYAGLKKPDWCL